MNRWFQGTGIAVLIALLGFWLWRHYGASDETRIRAVIGKMQRVIEAGEGVLMAAKLEPCIAPTYSDAAGMNKSQLIQYIVGYRSQLEAVSIYLTDLSITMQDEGTAEATFSARLVGRVKGNVTESEHYSDRFRLDFRKSDLGWQMTRSESDRGRAR